MRHCMPTAYSRYYYSAACLLRLTLCVLLQAESCEHHASTHAVASGGALKTPSSLAVDMALSAVCRGRHLSAARPSAVGLPTVALPGPACHHAAAGRQPFHVVRAAPDAGFTTSSSGAASTSSPMVSPFTQPGVHRQVGEAGTHPREMTVATVDKVLDEVRPVLMADGGDVEVVAVEEGGRVLLRLQGACSSCAASGATLKMGIERALEAAFGDQLTEVVQVDAGSGPPAGTAENIDLHLNLLRSAVASLGGEVRVLSAGSGVAVLGYRGPPAIGRGLVAAVKDAFKDIREVVLKDLPPEEGEQQQQQQPPPSSKAGSS